MAVKAHGHRITRPIAWVALPALFLIACSLPQDAGVAGQPGIGTRQSAPPTTSPALQGVVVQPLPTPVFGYQIINSWPHDPLAFTQGLVYLNGSLYESTGLNGRSSLRQVELETGRVLRKVDISTLYFAEGLAILGSRVFQLTWQTQKGFMYDLDSFAPLGEFSYYGEGWGLTHDGKQLILSDGSDRLRFMDPETFAVQRTLPVRDRGVPVSRLNELEYVRGEILANVWMTERIACIDPQTGAVIRWIDLKGLAAGLEPAGSIDVLNGIAYDESGDRLFVTGKFWPKLFQVRIKRP